MVENMLSEAAAYEKAVERDEAIAAAKQAWLDKVVARIGATADIAALIDAALAWEREPSVENIRALQGAVRKWRDG